MSSTLVLKTNRQTYYLKQLVQDRGDTMNPFASFACNSDAWMPVRENLIDPSPRPVKALTGGLKRKRYDEEGNPRIPQTKSDAGIAFMTQWWTDLRALTSNYPFAVMITGVIGAQARDVVSVAALRKLAAQVDNDIAPLKLSAFNVDSLEAIIRTVNHCRKKSKTIIDLSKIILRRAMPATRVGLCQLPGVGPMISDIVMEIAYGHAPLHGPSVTESRLRISGGKPCSVPSGLRILPLQAVANPLEDIPSLDSPQIQFLNEVTNSSASAAATSPQIEKNDISDNEDHHHDGHDMLLTVHSTIHMIDRNKEKLMNPKISSEALDTGCGYSSSSDSEDIWIVNYKKKA